MKRKIRSLPVNELFWLISLSSFSFFICGLFLGLDFLEPGREVTLPLLDSQIKIPGPSLWVIAFCTVAFVVYLVRMIVKSFWNLLANFIFLSSCIGLMIMIGYFLSRLRHGANYDHGMPADAFNFLAILQCLLIGVGAFAAIKTLRRIKGLSAT